MKKIDWDNWRRERLERKGSWAGLSWGAWLGIAGCVVVMIMILYLSESGHQRTWRQPARTVSAPGLWAEYDANEIAADAKYKGQVVVVTGVVARIRKGSKDFSYASLRTRSYGRDCYASNVHCYFSDRDLRLLAGLREGMQVNITGRVVGFALGTVLIRVIH